MAIKIIKGNKSDLSGVGNLSKGLQGKLFGDKGYISKDYSVKFTLKICVYLLRLEDKILLRKSVLIESVFNVLKNIMCLDHTRHRSPLNFLTHIITCVVSYTT